MKEIREQRKRLEEEIRTRWFKDHVAQHKVVHMPGGEVMERLLWRNPETTTFLVNYIRIGGILHVSGDVGCATYWWSGNNDLAWIGSCDLNYFAGKCEASENGRSFVVWDDEIARLTAKRYFDTLEEDYGYEPEEAEKQRARWAEYRGASHLCDETEWIAWMREHGETVLGPDWWESPLTRIGMVINPRCQSHLVGLKMAMAQVDEFKANKLKEAEEEAARPWYKKFVDHFNLNK